MYGRFVESNRYKALVKSVHERLYSFLSLQLDIRVKAVKAAQIGTVPCTCRLPAFIYFCLSSFLLLSYALTPSPH